MPQPTAPRLSRHTAPFALKRLEKILAPLDLSRLQDLAAALDLETADLGVGQGFALMFGAEKDAAKSEGSFKQMVLRLKDTQADAVQQGQLTEGEVVVLKKSAKAGDAPRRLMLLGRASESSQARLGDLEGAKAKGGVYENTALPAELLNPPEKGREPILLMTVNPRELEGLRAVFGQPLIPFVRDAHVYDFYGFDPNRRPIIGFRSEMGTSGPDAAILSTVRAIGHFLPHVVIAVGVAAGRRGDQSLGDVLVPKMVQSYEIQRRNKDSSIELRSYPTPATVAWFGRCELPKGAEFKLLKGLVISGEKLVDDPTFRAELDVQFPSNIGLEMECNGLMAACQNQNVNWILVKGVSDWGDGTKGEGTKVKGLELDKDQLQVMAAKHAAQIVYRAIHLKDWIETESDATPPCAKTFDFDNVRKPYDNHARHISMHSSLDKSERSKAEASPAQSKLTVQTAMLDWLQDAKGEPVFALLAEYGMGKTINCQRIYQHLRDLRAQGNAPVWAREPLYFDLRNLSLFKNLDRNKTVPLPSPQSLIDDLITHGWVNTGQGAAMTYADVQRHLRQGALIIQDGLDEVLVHLVEGQHSQFVRTLLNMVTDTQLDQDAQPPRMLLSCRSNFFKTLSDQQSLLTGQQSGQVTDKWYRAIEILPLAPEQVAQYLASVLPEIDPAVVQSLIADTHNLTELSQRPMTLKIIGDHIAELQAMRERGEPVNSAALYGLVARKWLERDNGKHHIVLEHKLRLMPALAAHLWASSVRSLPFDELHTWLHHWHQSQSDLSARYGPQTYHPEKIEEDLRTASFMVRQDKGGEKEGDGPNTEGFRFAHSSMQEYFLARYLADAVAADRFADWAMPQPSAETLVFLGELLTLDAAKTKGGVDKLSKTLNQWRTRYSAQASELLLDYSLRGQREAWPHPRPVLGGFELQGAQLRGWRFGQQRCAGHTPLLAMVGCNFSGADLREACFDQVRADDCVFDGAQLNNAAFQHSSLQRSQWLGADMTGAAWRHSQLKGSVMDAEPQVYRAHQAICDELIFHIPVAKKNQPLFAAPAWLSGHLDLVWAVSLSGDGRSLASGGSDGKVKLWDSYSGQCLLSLEGHDGGVNAVSLSADGYSLASGGRSRKVKLWDTTNGQCLLSLEGHSGGVNAVSLSADGRSLASGGDDGQVKLWDSTTGRCLHTLYGHSDGVRAVSLSADGCSLASSGGDGKIKLWHSASGRCLHTLESHDGRGLAVSLSADGHSLASGGSGGKVKVWDCISGQILHSLEGHNGGVLAVSLSADGRFLASGGSDGKVKLWDTTSGLCVHTLEGNSGWVRAVSLSSAGRLLSSSGDDGRVRLWDCVSGQSLQMLKDHGRVVSAMSMTSDVRSLACGGLDGEIKLWDTVNGQCLHTFEGHDGSVWAVSLSADGRSLATGGSDGKVKLWNCISGQCMNTLDCHTGVVWAVSLSADGKTLASGGDDGTVKLWDSTIGKCLHSIKGHIGVVRVVCLSSDGSKLASGGSDGKIKLWDSISGRCMHTLDDQNGAVSALSMSADGLSLVSGGQDRRLRLWNSASGEFLRTLEGHGGAVLAVCMSLDGISLASAGSDGRVKLWDCKSGQCIQNLEDQNGWVRVVSLSADGSSFASGGDDGKIKLWDSASGRCVWMAAPFSNSIRNNDVKENSFSAAWFTPGPRQADGCCDPPGRITEATGDAWRYLAWQVWHPDIGADGQPLPYPQGRLERMPIGAECGATD